MLKNKIKAFLAPFDHPNELFQHSNNVAVVIVTQLPRSRVLIGRASRMFRMKDFNDKRSKKIVSWPSL